MTALAGIETGSAIPGLQLPAITRTTLALFAGGSGDHNPIHIDVDFAHSAGMPDVFAHGMLSMAYLGRLLTNWVPQEQIRSLSARFVSITPVGASPTGTATVTAVEQDGTETIARLAVEVRLTDGTVTLQGEATVALPTNVDQRSVQ